MEVQLFLCYPIKCIVSLIVLFSHTGCPRDGSVVKCYS